MRCIRPRFFVRCQHSFMQRAIEISSEGLLRGLPSAIFGMSFVKPVASKFFVLAALLAFDHAAQTAASEAASNPRVEQTAQKLGSAGSQHWSLRPPEHPTIPKVHNDGWVRNPIDAFVLARLELERLAPSLEADRRALLRRLSFDLLGVPPKIEEVEAFVADKRPDAYELLVDHLLASPHFGERWGRHWLDLARYADSDGYEKDSVRPYAYLYRDWVIDAINRDLPFDRFSIEQLAGDLLPNATEEQKIATGFHRNTLTNKEGGVDQEEFRCKATVDRVSTTGTVWLGLTLGCAECHNHKYDPISQREFYQLFAFFNNASETDLPAPRPAELAQYKKAKEIWEDQRARIQAELESYLDHAIASRQEAWEQDLKLPAERWSVLVVKKASSSGGATMEIQSDHSIQVTGQNPAKDTYQIEATTELKTLTGFRLEVLDDPAPARGPGRGKNNNFVLSEFVVKLDVGGSERLTETRSERLSDSTLAQTSAVREGQSLGSPHPDPLPREKEQRPTVEEIPDRSGIARAQDSILPLPA
ncbi:MAG: DUF1549 domain-containing protein, partial [Verrucomicrobia bacterium]|nr:DUF1549 domain-containing protein [Verrucomicrobiota bacterium]